ncbi:MAG: HipA N-terminal domain-containing protein [Treponema sp.]
MSKNIFVYADWESISKPTLIGILNADLLRGKEIFSFEYDSQWLKTQQFFLDPDLMLYKGRQYTQHDKTLFGIFTDSCPDRWGRLLMTRREAIFAREENRTVRIRSVMFYGNWAGRYYQLSNASVRYIPDLRRLKA